MDGLRVRVREQWIFDLVSIGKIFQDFFRVIADGRQLDPLFFESRDGALQLDQLPFAERSPVGGTEKEKNDTVRTLQAIESLHVAKLVMSRKSGSLLADPESDRHQRDGSHANRTRIECPADGYAISQMGGYGFLRLKAVHHPVRVIKQRQFRTGKVLGALGNFGKGFVRVASAGHKGAGPGTGFYCVALPRHCEGGHGKKHCQIEEEAFRQ